MTKRKREISYDLDKDYNIVYPSKKTKIDYDDIMQTKQYPSDLTFYEYLLIELTNINIIPKNIDLYF